MIRVTVNLPQIKWTLFFTLQCLLISFCHLGLFILLISSLLQFHESMKSSEAIHLQSTPALSTLAQAIPGYLVKFRRNKMEP